VGASFSRKVCSSCLMDNPSSSRTSLIEVVKGGRRFKHVVRELMFWISRASMSAHVRAFSLDPVSERFTGSARRTSSFYFPES